MPETEYRTLARLGGDPGPRGDKGDAGAVGPAGPRGLPGVNALPADEATAAYASAPDAETYRAIDATWARRGELDQITAGAAKGLATGPAIGYGHSYIAGTGLTPSQYWAARLAASMGVGYTNRGIGGALAEDVAWRMWSNTSNGFSVGSRATIICQAMLNSLRLNGVDEATWRGVNYALRTIVAVASAAAFVSAEDSRFSYSTAGWSAFTTGQNDFPGGVYRATSTTTGAGAYVEFTTQTTPNGTALLTLGRKVGLAPGLTEIRRMDTNAVILLWDNQNNAAAGIAQNYTPVAFSLNVPRGTVIRVTNLAVGGGPGVTTICGLLERDEVTPNRIVLMKEPKLANWAASTMFPNGSDEAVDYFNQIIDNIAAERSNVIAVKPEPWWDKTNAATLVQADQVHPTDEGNQRLRQAALAALAGTSLAASGWSVGDTGWVNLADYIAAGFTGTLQGRRRGPGIELAGQITGTIPSGAQTRIVEGLPSAWRPITAGATGAAYMSQPGAAAGLVRVASSGNINAVQSTGADVGSCIFSASYDAPMS